MRSESCQQISSPVTTAAGGKCTKFQEKEVNKDLQRKTLRSWFFALLNYIIYEHESLNYFSYIFVFGH